MVTINFEGERRRNLNGSDRRGEEERRIPRGRQCQFQREERRGDARLLEGPLDMTDDEYGRWQRRRREGVRGEREKVGSQQYLVAETNRMCCAKLIGSTTRPVGRWPKGRVLPLPLPSHQNKDKKSGTNSQQQRRRRRREE